MLHFVAWIGTNLVDLVKSFPTSIYLQNRRRYNRERASQSSRLHLSECTCNCITSKKDEFTGNRHAKCCTCPPARRNRGGTGPRSHGGTPRAACTPSTCCRSCSWSICTRRAGKLYKARSRLYRTQMLQVMTQVKALAKIYTTHSFAELANINSDVQI